MTNQQAGARLGLERGYASALSGMGRRGVNAMFR
jgi:hypothetical protein